MDCAMIDHGNSMSAGPSIDWLVLAQVQEKREDLEHRILTARNARGRSPLRKELWRLDQLADLLKWWAEMHSPGESE
jgi:hypothetical protein